jgi:hypothetical protein
VHHGGPRSQGRSIVRRAYCPLRHHRAQAFPRTLFASSLLSRLRNGGARWIALSRREDGPSNLHDETKAAGAKSVWIDGSIQIRRCLSAKRQCIGNGTASGWSNVRGGVGTCGNVLDIHIADAASNASSYSNEERVSPTVRHRAHAQGTLSLEGRTSRVRCHVGPRYPFENHGTAALLHVHHSHPLSHRLSRLRLCECPREWKNGLLLPTLLLRVRKIARAPPFGVFPIEMHPQRLRSVHLSSYRAHQRLLDRSTRGGVSPNGFCVHSVHSRPCERGLLGASAPRLAISSPFLWTWRGVGLGSASNSPLINPSSAFCTLALLADWSISY